MKSIGIDRCSGFNITRITYIVLAKSANISVQGSVSTLSQTYLSQVSTSKILVGCLIIPHLLKSNVLHIWNIYAPHLLFFLCKNPVPYLL